MTTSQTLFIAELETSHFTFRSAGTSRSQALSTLKSAWNRHRRQTGATYRWADVEEEVRVWEASAGLALRDGMEV